MTGLWLPPGTPQRGVTLPGHNNLTLSDGRVLKRVPIPAAAPRIPTMTQCRAWIGDDGMTVTASVDLTEKFGPLAHGVVSYPDRQPTWDDIHAVRDALFPEDLDFMMVLPKRADYVNVHPFALHITQCPVTWGIG